MRKALSLIIIIVLTVSLLLPFSSIAETPNANIVTREWARSNGYTFPIYGSTTTDLTIISDYITLLEDNKIYLNPTEMYITDKDTRTMVSIKIADNFYLMYTYFSDKDTYNFTMQFPYSYRPLQQASILLFMHIFCIDENEAADIYDTLIYNIINKSSSIKYADSTIWYDEIGTSSIFILVQKYVPEESDF